MSEELEVAIVFADVVGSTQLYEILGDDAAREVVRRCLEIMTGATDTAGGTVIKTMGDEVMSICWVVDVISAIDYEAICQIKITLRSSSVIKVIWI